MTGSKIYPPGTNIRLVSDPGRLGVLTGKHREQAGIRKYQVAFPEGKSFQPEYELQIIEEDNSDWDELIRSGKFGRIRDLRRSLTHIHLSGRLANLVYSMDATNTDFYAYQYKPVLSFLESPSNGLLIADEVGLGKTIEAGLIWTELRARYDARQLLVVCPAMLRNKWAAELRNRFGVDAEIKSAAELLELFKNGKFKVPDGKGIVCSYQGILPPKGWDEEDDKPISPRKALARFFDEQAEDAPLIDLVIFDEAHYMRNPSSQTSKLGLMLRDVSEHVVLLSATPINLKSDDLFHLLNLVDPDSFDVKEVFPQVLSANEPLQKVRELCLNLKASEGEITSMLEEAAEHPLLHNSHQLKALIEEGVDENTVKSRPKRIKLANKIERINLLRNAVNRTRKAEVTEWRVIREPIKKFIDLDHNGPEWNFYQSVTNTIRQYAYSKDISDGFLLAGPQRQVSSCMYAAALSWQTKIDNYNEQLYEDFGHDTDSKYEISPLLEIISNEVMPGINLEELRRHDSKYDTFKRTVLNYLKTKPHEKVIVFSFFRNTLHYLQDRLAEDGISAMVLMGGMKETKQELIERFRDDAIIRVLLSSEVASEGVDLQFSKVLVNYDLPWNPMKVEQRIGRIDRLGQKADKISIINLLYSSTIDHKIHERLYERLNIFEKALGGMEAILGEQISDLTSDLLSKPLTEQQENDRIEQTAMAVERIRQDQDELEQNASHLIAHGGYILDEVNAAHQFKKRITEYDLVAYTKDYLDKYCQGFEFIQLSNDELRFDIRLPTSVAPKLSEFINSKKLYGQTSMARGNKVSCIFANRVRDPKSRLETVSQFHPLIRFISQDLRERDEAFYPVIAIQVNSTNENIPGIYAFYVSRWEFSGIKNEEELPVRAFDIAREEILGSEESWSLLNHARVNGRDWLSVSNECDVELVADGVSRSEAQLDIDYQKEKTQRENENQDRVELQIQSAQNHCDRLLRSQNELLERHQRNSNPIGIRLTEGKIDKIKERFEYRVAELKQKSTLSTSQHEVCCGVVNVILEGDE